MNRAWLSLGSNIDRFRHINRALDALEARFGELVVSPVYESEAVGFDGDHFLNLVVGIQTELPVGKLAALLKQIEDDHGRDRSAPKFSARTLDIDILTYADLGGEVDGVVLPRDEVLKNAFVLAPLAEVAADQLHPLTGRSFSEHWRAYDQQAQPLWRVEFIRRQQV